jgi:hypothetical protein
VLGSSTYFRISPSVSLYSQFRAAEWIFMRFDIGELHEKLLRPFGSYLGQTVGIITVHEDLHVHLNVCIPALHMCCSCHALYLWTNSVRIRATEREYCISQEGWWGLECSSNEAAGYNFHPNNNWNCYHCHISGTRVPFGWQGLVVWFIVLERVFNLLQSI